MSATAAEPRTSVVICAYTFDRWEELGAAVASVQAQTRPAHELFVVVDRNPELLARAREAFGDEVLVVPNEDVDGLSGARMTGARQATGDVIAFLDDDAVADPGWLAAHEAAYDDPDVVGVGGHVRPLWRDGAPSWFPDELLWVVGSTWAGHQHAGGRIRGPIGANMSVRADVLRRVGSFAPELGRLEVGKSVAGTADETELAIRAARMHPGGYWAYRQGASVAHVVTPERGTWSYLVRRCRVEGAAKAALTRLTGSEDGLGAERSYVRSVIPRAVLRELGAVLRGRPAGLARAAALVVAVAVTAGTYLRARLRLGLAARRGG